MVTYLAKFIENLSDKSHLLRELIKNDIKWNWTEAHSKAFQDLKKIIGNTKTLKYFNPQEPVTIKCDASDYGLGTVFLQNV